MAFSASWEQQQLAKILVRLRQQQEPKMTIMAAAKAAGMDRLKLQRLERAERKAAQYEIVALCKVYGVAVEETKRLCEMAHASSTDTWWDRYQQWLSPSYVDFIRFENEARSVVTTQPALIPGLMQTPEYIRGLYDTGVIVQNPTQVEALIQVRRMRQRRLTEHPEPLKLTAIVGEAALRSPYGGLKTFHAQLRYLRELLDMPNVTVHVATLGSPVVFLPIQVLEFEGDSAVVVTETPWGNLLHDSDLEIMQVRHIIANVQSRALPEAQSVAFIEQQIRETA